MEFGMNEGEVTLVQFTPINRAESFAESYRLENYDDHSIGYQAARGDQHTLAFGGQLQQTSYAPPMESMSGVSSMAMEVCATPSPIPPPAPTTMYQQQASQYYCPSEQQYPMEPSSQSLYNLMSHQPQQSQQAYNDYIHSPQVASPAVSIATSYDSQPGDLDGLADIIRNGVADPGPQPVRISRVDEGPPRTKESAYSPNIFFTTPRGQSNPHSPNDMRFGKSDTLKASRRHRSIVSANSLKGSICKRQSSPIFPDSSTPLSSVSLSRHPSITSLCSSTKSDPFSTMAPSVRSDPGPYRTHQNGIDSAIDSPTVMSAQGSPKFEFTSTASSTHSIPVSTENSSRSCMEIAMPMKLVRKITDLDKKILKLQADRTKLLEKANQTKSSSFDRVDEQFDTHMLTDKSSETGKVHLYIVPLGIHSLDEPLYEDANAILRQVGGLYFDYQSAVENLRSICCKGMVRLPDISTCFAYIKSLLNENQKLKLGNSTTGFYRIQLDLDGTSQSDGTVPTEFVEALRVANEVMRCAQQITKAYPTVQMQLQQVRQMAASKSDQCDSICQNLGILDRERRTQIKSVLEANCTIMSTVERVWPQYYQIAMETIKTITECIHPQA